MPCWCWVGRDGKNDDPAGGAERLLPAPGGRQAENLPDLRPGHAGAEEQ